MKITLISHASVVIDSGDLRIWTDPWLHGRAFNESWSLLVPAAFEPALLDTIDYVWISHEHPDHFHVPTLQQLPAAFKDRVTVLFQMSNSDKMLRAFERLSFKNLRTLPHREVVTLDEATSAYCYEVGQMDSCLAVMNGDECVLNVNDAEINKKDCVLLRKDLGAPQIILNQFSVAGYHGLPDHQQHLTEQSRRILSNMAANHVALGADVTIPIASFIYFSRDDNRYVNAYANTPRDVVRFFDERELDCTVLFPGDTFKIGVAHDSSEALERYDSAYTDLNELPHYPTDTIALDEVAAAFKKRLKHLRERYPAIVLRRLRPVVAELPDLGAKIVFSVGDGRFEEVNDNVQADLILNSQPLHYVFAFPWGLQTLGVSARYKLVGDVAKWKRYRILFALDNAEIYLRARDLFTRANWRFLRPRLRGARNQLIYQLRRM